MCCKGAATPAQHNMHRCFDRPTGDSAHRELEGRCGDAAPHCALDRRSGDAARCLGYLVGLGASGGGDEGGSGARSAELRAARFVSAARCVRAARLAMGMRGAAAECCGGEVACILCAALADWFVYNI